MTVSGSSGRPPGKMGRQLRPRKGRPQFLEVQEPDDDDSANHAGPSKHLEEHEEDSGSDFVPEVAEQPLDVGLDLESHDPPALEKTRGQRRKPISVVSESLSNQVEQSAKVKGKRKARPESPSKSSHIQLAPGLSRPSTRQMYALPTPSLHHRHRAVALFSRPGQVERLECPPPLFGPIETVLTNNFTHNALVTDRTNKAWGYSVGSGPLWDLVEDRGWYKEALPDEHGVGKETSRRPTVYMDQRVLDGLTILEPSDALPYLPSDLLADGEELQRGLPSITCSFGPFAQQIPVDLKMFDARKMSEFIPESKAHVFYAGAPVWGLDWCPVHPNERSSRFYKQYLAVAPYSSPSFSPDIGYNVPRPSHACVQIWSLNPGHLHVTSHDAMVGIEDVATPDHNTGSMICEMVLCVDAGPAQDLRWCPLPSHDNITEIKDMTRPRKLGLLAGIFLDGSMSVYIVPEPLDVLSARHDASRPVFVHLPNPLLRAELEETSCCCLDWANSEVLAVGTTNGIIAVYNIGEVLKSFPRHDTRYQNTTVNIFPTHYITVHQSAIRAVCWIRTPPTNSSGAYSTDDDPTVIASGGYDGLECLTDIREGAGSVMNRTRDIISTTTFSPFVGGPVTIDHENVVKAYSVSPSMLGRGHTLFEPDGPVWSIHSSDYHPHLAVGSADGTCSTTNSLRSTRRGGSVPFFIHKIYQMDYNRNLMEFRMLERFLPSQTQDKPTSTAKNRAESEKISSGAWPQQVGIQRVVWNTGNGLGAAGLLASATGSGICRIDRLSGRWLKGKIPYGSIPKVRGELNTDDMDIDGSQSEE